MATLKSGNTTQAAIENATDAHGVKHVPPLVKVSNKIKQKTLLLSQLDYARHLTIMLAQLALVSFYVRSFGVERKLKLSYEIFINPSTSLPHSRRPFISVPTNATRVTK